MWALFYYPDLMWKMQFFAKILVFNTHVAKGGNTATGVNPEGTRFRAAFKVGMLLSVGEPPPPIGRRKISLV